MYELIIIGGGPAGMAAAIYAARAELDFVVIEGSMMPGGQVLTTSDVDNYPGLPGVGGFELGNKLAEHAKALGARFMTENVLSMKAEGSIKIITTEKNTYESRSVIISTGAVHRKAGVRGEEEYAGRGVSYCATCDGAFFRNKVAAVVGGGDVALEDALYLSRLCSKVYLIHRRDEFRAAKSLVTKAKQVENIEFILDSIVEEIKGENKVTSVIIRNKKTDAENEIAVNGVFFAVGMQPMTAYVDEAVAVDEAGYILAGEDCCTNIEGVFAAGDIRTKQLRQIITAVADGANAVTSVEKYLQ